MAVLHTHMCMGSCLGVQTCRLWLNKSWTVLCDTALCIHNGASSNAFLWGKIPFASKRVKFVVTRSCAFWSLPASCLSAGYLPYPLAFAGSERAQGHCIYSGDLILKPVCDLLPLQVGKTYNSHKVSSFFNIHLKASGHRLAQIPCPEGGIWHTEEVFYWLFN